MQTPQPQSGQTTGPAENTPTPQHLTTSVVPNPVRADAPPLPEGTPVTLEEAMAHTVTVPPPDPLDVFLDSGRAVLKGLDEELLVLKTRREKLARLLAEVEAEEDAAARKRAQVDAGIQAAISAALGLADAAKAPGRATDAAPAPAGGGRFRGASGYVPQPGKVSQKEWVLSRLPADGAEFSIQDVVDPFSAEYGVTRQQAIKNISSLLGYQTRDPKPEWPAVQRVRLGVYRVLPGVAT